ncbi:Retrovirus-related Pol polyprotein from transposon TNT 1-94 [Quillaja saponaria]|uniref:Retrovirus-related Pol polyprotein from transposon TNT 1-94 n=1 Tax=Quillaja saponaria TaxID=32244 RepID=A0AAD7LNL7_QUISA|nr:Retrovirus-related Pol polyprotein from transposon TNT 1-94 [Quillaja saponaria]
MSEEVVSPGNGSSGSRSRVGISNDNPSLQISPVKFDGNNFLAWSRSCLLFIQARGLYGYVIGSKSKPANGDPLLESWISENSLVMSWLINSMQPQISRGYLLLDSADKMWTALCQTYSQVRNDIQVFELRKKLHETKQGELTIAQYFAELSGLWQELDYYQEYQLVHHADAASYKKVVDKERVYDFLAGLNLEYDQIRVQVLGRDPFPNLRQTYAYVQQEESRRIAMLHVVTRERSAMVATPIPKESKGVHTRGIEIARGSDKDDLQCDYCGPPRSRAHVSETVESSPSTESSALNPEEMQHLRSLMAKLDGCPSTSAASSHHAPSHHAFGTHSTTDSEPWIIDSGASDHMTGTSRNFSTYFPCSGKDKVRVADGSLSTISGKGDNPAEVSKLKSHLAKEFEIKDLGKLCYFLGIEVAHSDRGIFLSQRQYVLDLLEETCMLGCRPATTPIETNHKLQSGDGEYVDRERYQRLVGRLIYLSHTRPDIAYAVSVVSQFMHDPRSDHLDAVHRILRYLKSAPGKGLLFENNRSLKLEAYTDADWAGSLDDRRSTSGYCTFVGGNLVSWRSKKQTVVSRSSA